MLIGGGYVDAEILMETWRDARNALNLYITRGCTASTRYL